MKRRFWFNILARFGMYAVLLVSLRVGSFCGGNREADARAQPRGEARRHPREALQGVTGCRSKRFAGGQRAIKGRSAFRPVKLSHCLHPKRRATESASSYGGPRHHGPTMAYDPA